MDNGTLPAGSRVPSLRQISKQRQISLSSALQAYRLLEERGVLEARPQSVFYVARGRVSPRESAISKPPGKATTVLITRWRDCDAVSRDARTVSRNDNKHRARHSDGPQKTGLPENQSPFLALLRHADRL
jgi:DNA-binding transcriptional MocR family regulator